MVNRLDGTDDAVLWAEKSNLCKRPPALRFGRKEGTKAKEHADDWQGDENVTASCIVWKGECADPVLNQVATPQAERECRDFLNTVFADCDEIPSETIQQEAKRAGMSWRTLQYYKAKLGARSFKKRDGRWWWKREECKDKHSQHQ